MAVTVEYQLFGWFELVLKLYRIEEKDTEILITPTGIEISGVKVCDVIATLWMSYL